jgi:exodeoxyribonuclease-3
MRFDKAGQKVSIISCYFPSGSSSEERQEAKFRFLSVIQPHLAKLRKEREFILIGDVNIAHKEADLKNWKGNLKNSGFLPEERSWMTQLLDPAGDTALVDVYRHLHPLATDDCYTWWSNRGQARAKNVGWRIDYHLATPALAETAHEAAVFKAQWFSDHAPLTIDYGFSI